MFVDFLMTATCIPLLVTLIFLLFTGRCSDATETVIWFGASDLSAEGGWEWNDGSPFRYLNWNAGMLI